MYILEANIPRRASPGTLGQTELHSRSINIGTLGSGGNSPSRLQNAQNIVWPFAFCTPPGVVGKAGTIRLLHFNKSDYLGMLGLPHGHACQPWLNISRPISPSRKERKLQLPVAGNLCVQRETGYDP